METVASLVRGSSPSKWLQHKERNHLLVFEGGKFSYVTIPPLPSSVEDPVKLCFVDHNDDKWDPRTEQCCLREVGHVHAHYHHGEIIEDILLEQCIDEAGCSLPARWELPGVCFADPLHSHDHKHKEGCGHDQIAHGDHFDWLVPLNDGSFLLSHSQASDDGSSKFIEHGRLVRVGKSLGRLTRHSRQLFDLFGYESPKRKGYESLPLDEAAVKDTVTDNLKSTRLAKDVIHSLLPLPDAGKIPIQEENVILEIPDNPADHALKRTTLDVLGICCPAEVPLIKRILEPLPGVKEVTVNVTSKTVTILHDPVSTSEGYLVKLLNEARLDATIHRQGEWKIAHKWPSPYTVASGVLVAISFFSYIFSPLKWVALGAVAVGVPPIILRALVSLRHFILDINVLMLIAVAGAIGLGDFLEAGSIVFLFTLADWLESRSSEKARLAVSAVVNLQPQNAVLADGGLEVPVAEVKVGTKLAVKAGESVPIDGVVISGKSSVDESSLTGESIPVEKEVGAIVWAGTVNMSGFLCIETTALSEDSAVARMVRLVEDAQAKRSRTEQLVEQFAKYYTPAVVLAAITVAIIPWAAHAHDVHHWLYLSLVLLVVACPCALVISTPVVTTCGIAQAARMGLIIKGGSFLEALGKLKVVAIDKTGTLTEGHFRVAEVLVLDESIDFNQMLYWISCLESRSSHPMAASLVAYARLCGVEPSDEIESFEILPGEGVFGIVDGHQIHIGNCHLALRLGWIEAVDSTIVEHWSNLETTVCWVGMDGRAMGIFSVGDQVRQEAAEAVSDLKKLGLRVAMLTGDSAAAANAVHKMIGEIDVFSELLPQDKVRVLQELKEVGMTGMVGDGINDGPALAAADVSFAMGVAGSAVAMETSDIALMTNDLRKVAAAVRLGWRSRIKIQQNIILSFITKVLIIALAAAGYASLWAAVLADVGTCLIVVFNSMLLLDRKKGHGFCGAARCHSHNHKGKAGGGDCCSKSSLVKLADAPLCCEFRRNGHDGLKSAHGCGGATATNRCCGNITGGMQVHTEEFGVAKPCCDVSGKSLSSGIRRRLGHKETCTKDCQGVDCFSLISTPEGVELPVTMHTTLSRGSDPEKHCCVGDSSHSHGRCLDPSDVTSESNPNVHHCCSIDHTISFHESKINSRVQRRLGHKETCANDCQALDCLPLVSKTEGLEIREDEGNSGSLNASYSQGKDCCASGSAFCQDAHIKPLDVAINANSDEQRCCGKDCHSSFHGGEPYGAERHHCNSSCGSQYGEMGKGCDSGNSCHLVEIQDTRSIKHTGKGVPVKECQRMDSTTEGTGVSMLCCVTEDKALCSGGNGCHCQGKQTDMPNNSIAK